MKIGCALFGHQWDGCRCKRCGASNHDWDHCKCRRCGDLFLRGSHDFDENGICKICGSRLRIVEGLDTTCRDGCGSGSGYGCTGDVATCIESDRYYTEYAVKTITKHLKSPDGREIEL